MSSKARSIKRNQAAQPAELSEAEKRLPSARVTSDPVTGTFNTVPILGWISRRAKEGTPLVMLSLILLEEDGSLAGNLQVELPMYPETERATLGVLTRYGWTGGLWAPDSTEWPTGDVETAGMLESLITGTDVLRATLTFPPGVDGFSAMQALDVTRGRGSFLMPALPEVETTDPVLLARLRELCANNHQFYLLS